MKNIVKMFEKSTYSSSYKGVNNSSILNLNNIQLYSNDYINSDKIRKHLINFYRFSHLNVMDLGVAITSNNVILSNEGLKKSPIILISSNIFFKTLYDHKETIIIDKHLNFDNYNTIAYQRHFGNHEMSNFNSSIGLGEFRQLKSNMEVYFREAKYLHFNFDAIRSSDIPCNESSSLTGLTSEEACQIMRYIGESNNLELVTFEYNDDSDCFDDKSAELIAMMIWYLFEGRTFTKNHPKNSDDFKSYIVELQEIDYTLEFLQSNVNDKWWVISSSKKYLPCTFDDYQSTINNDLPPRILNFITSH